MHPHRNVGQSFRTAAGLLSPALPGRRGRLRSATKWGAGAQKLTTAAAVCSPASPMARRLFVGISKLDQLRLRPGAPVNRHSRGKRAAARIAHWHINRREAGGGRIELAIISVRRVHIADQPRRIAPCRIDESVQFELVHRLEHRIAHLFSIGGIRFARWGIGTVFGAFVGGLQAALIVRMESA